MGKKVSNITTPTWQYGSSGLLYSKWSFSKTNRSHTDHYVVQWQYKVPQTGINFKESKSNVDSLISTFNPPDNASEVRIGVKPVAKKKKYKTKTKKGKKVTKTKLWYKNAQWAYSKWLTLSKIYDPPDVNPVPTNYIRFSIETGTSNKVLVDWSSYDPAKEIHKKIPSYSEAQIREMFSSYTVYWSYSPENNPSPTQWRDETEITGIKVKNCTISPESNAKHIRVRIAPVSVQNPRYGTSVSWWECVFKDTDPWATYNFSTGVSGLTPGVGGIDYKTISIQPQSGGGKTVYATWSWASTSWSTLDHYSVKWEYATGNDPTGGPWFPGTTEDVETELATYSVPDNATFIRVSIKPVAQDTSGGYPYWEAPWSPTVAVSLVMYPPEKPSTPTVTINGTKIRASITNYNDLTAKSIQFEFYKRKSALGIPTMSSRPTIAIILGEAITETNATIGYGYQVRCRAYNGSVYSDWSDLSETVYTPPATPKGFTVLKAESESSVRASWDAVETAEEYEIQYTSKKEYFDNTDVESVNGITTTTRIITDISPGFVYWFRLRAKRGDLYSGWCEPKSVAVGTKPDAPTTWTLVTTFLVGQSVTFYWTHNSQDGSEQTAARLKLTINGVEQAAIPISGNTNEYTYNTSSLADGATILWKVQTKGIVAQYSDWSVQRKVMIHAAATLDMADYDNPSAFWQDLNEEEQEAYADYIGQNVGLPESFSVFPLYIAAVAGPSNQNAIRYFISIVANEAYETVDFDGQTKYVSEGDEVFTEVIDAIGHHLLRVLTPSDINLDNSISYTVKVSVSMDTGLTADAEAVFTVVWADNGLDPDAELDYDEDDLVCYITPFCDAAIEEAILDDNGEPLLDDANTALLGVTYVDRYTNAYLSVFRCEYDGTYTEIARNLDSAESVTVTDPHPALDYARYRITAVDKDSGEIYYSDLPGEPCGETSVVIQWDEAWVPFAGAGNEDYEEVEPPYSGSTLMLPYDIDVSTNYQPDVTLAEYIGRRHPVSYYGTQKGETATWNVNIWDDDEETLYGLRRLANYPGDVYVREPSGSGYWAHVTVSFSQKHNDLVVPVTLSITRVEGGM